jgi:cell division protein FtsA
MNIEDPLLFVEINEINYNFIAGTFDGNQNFKIIDKIIAINKSVNRNQFTNIEEVSTIIKSNVEKIEKKLNYIFKYVTIIIDNFDYSCVNISGFKKLNGSQVLKENISYILNSLKLSINENEEKKSILHIFNSKSVLDGSIVENLPIGLFGDFYIHELSFFLIRENDLKNINQVFNKSNLEIKKVFLKSFSEGVQLINKNNIETFFKIDIDKEHSKISYFDQASFRYTENFNFGSNIILKDIVKICSIDSDTITALLSNKVFDNQKLDEKDLVENKYFTKDNYRKIRKKLILDIVDARVEEITDIICNKNINLKYLNKKNLKFYIYLKDKLIENNFKYCFLKKFNTEAELMGDTAIEDLIIGTSKLTTYGWKKEAIPIIQTKKSLITRIFKSIFG